MEMDKAADVTINLFFNQSSQTLNICGLQNHRPNSDRDIRKSYVCASYFNSITGMHEEVLIQQNTFKPT
jgi:hypothetical protein